MAKSFITLTQFDVQGMIADAFGITPDKVTFVYPPKLDVMHEYLLNRVDRQTPFFNVRIEADIKLNDDNTLEVK